MRVPLPADWRESSLKLFGLQRDSKRRVELLVGHCFGISEVKALEGVHYLFVLVLKPLVNLLEAGRAEVLVAQKVHQSLDPNGHSFLHHFKALIEVPWILQQESLIEIAYQAEHHDSELRNVLLDFLLLKGLFLADEKEGIEIGLEDVVEEVLEAIRIYKEILHSVLQLHEVLHLEMRVVEPEELQLAHGKRDVLQELVKIPIRIKGNTGFVSISEKNLNVGVDLLLSEENESTDVIHLELNHSLQSVDLNNLVVLR